MKKHRMSTLRMVTAGILALTMLPFSGCSQKKDEEEKLNIAVIIKDKTSTYWSPVEQACNDLEEEFGNMIEITYLGPNGESIENQITLIEDAISNHVDAIVLAACSTTEENDVLKKAVEEAKIPVITIDSDVTYEGRSAYVGTMNFSAGKNAARYSAGLIDNEGTIGIIYHGAASTATERREGFVEQLKSSTEPEKSLAAGAGSKQNNSVHDDATAEGEVNLDDTFGQDVQQETKKSAYANIKIAEILDGESKWDVSKEQAIKLIKEDHVDLIFATNRKGTWGACEAVSELTESGDIKEGAVKVVGFDNFENEGKNAESYISRDILDAVIVQNPYNMGYLGVRYAMALCNGEVIPSQVDTGAIFVTSDNINDDDIQFLISN